MDLKKSLEYEDDIKLQDDKLQEAYSKSEQVAIIVVLKLIYLTTKIDLYKDFKLKIPLSSNKSNNLKSGEILLTNSESNTVYRIYLDIVDKDYDLLDSIKNTSIINKDLNDDIKFSDIDEISRNKIINIMSFLTQACYTVFNNLKEKYKELLEYSILLDDNTTIYLDYNLEKRIGIVFSNY